MELILSYFDDVERTGQAKLRFAQRLLPIMGTTAASMPEIVALTQKVASISFPPTPTTFKIDIHLRNHTTLDRDDVIANVAECVPKERGHTVSLKLPDKVLLIEIFKSVCMISILPHYDRFRKFNPHQLVKARHEREETKSS